MLETYLAVLARAARDPNLTAAQREVLELQCIVERASLELQQERFAGWKRPSSRQSSDAGERAIQISETRYCADVVAGSAQRPAALYCWRDRHTSKPKIQL